MPIFHRVKKLFLICIVLLSATTLPPALAQESEKTYAISLTKTAGLQQGKIQEVKDKKVLVSPYVVAKGEHLWEILRKNKLLKMGEIGEVLSVLRELNPALGNLDLIHPGQQILIPLRIVPVSGAGSGTAPIVEKMDLADLKNLKMENYTVQPGDALTRVIEGRYHVPAKKLYGEYLSLVKKLNPNMKDINVILPGQRIRLPIYSPEVVRKSIIPERFQEKKQKAPKERVSPVSHDLTEIFSELGMDWVTSGQLFIPLRAGGQINLRAESFPVLNAPTGNRVIVDLHNELPSRVADLIQSSWKWYRVVHLTAKDPLRSALGKIIAECDFVDSDGTRHPLQFGGDVQLRITGDWLLPLSGGSSEQRRTTAVLTLREPYMPAIPWMIQDYLAGLGIKVIDYPPGDSYPKEKGSKPHIISAPDDPIARTEMILERLGHKFTRSVDIPIYKSEVADLKLLIRADIFLKSNGVDCVMDFSGLGEKMQLLLKEHGFRVLSLHSVKDPLEMLSETLRFLGVPFQQGAHSFMACKRDASRNIQLTMKGVSFKDEKGQSVLAIRGTLPEEIVAFLQQNGYEVLGLHGSGSPQTNE
jgi:LysM repeat protein